MAEMKTSNFSWQEQLKADLEQPTRKTDSRLALLGIGNELNGDDAAGVWIARRLLALMPENSNTLILDCGQVPENAIGRLRRFKPTFVLMVDAAEIDSPAGAVKYINPHDTSGFSASSHSLPFKVLASYLEKEFNCAVRLLGIQPASLDFDVGLSSEVKNSITHILKELAALLRSR